MFNKAQQFLKDLRPVKELEKVWGDVQVCSELKFSNHNEYYGSVSMQFMPEWLL